MRQNFMLLTHFRRDLGYVFAAVGTDNVHSKGQTFDVLYSIFHDKYDKPYNDNIALVRIAGDIEFGDNVRAIALSTYGYNDYNRLGKIVGWFVVVRCLSIKKLILNSNFLISHSFY